MKYSLLFPLIFILVIACKSTNDSNTQKAETTTETKTTHPDSLLVKAIRNTQCALNEQELIRPTAQHFSFEGKIDNTHAINLYLSYNISNKDEVKNTVFASGTYNYTGKKESLQLSGELNLTTKEITLYVEKNGKKDEAFTGKCSDNFDNFSGTWEKISKKKKMPFELKKTGQRGSDISTWMQYLFALKLNQILQECAKNPLAVAADSAGIDKHGLYIHNLSSSFPPDFYPNYFSAYYEYESTARFVEHDILAEIWTLENNPIFFIFINQIYNGHDITEEGIADEANAFHEDKSELWVYKNNVFENILVFDDEQKDADKNYISKTVNMEWYAIIENGVTTIFEKKTNKAWIWDSSKGKWVSK